MDFLKNVQSVENNLNNTLAYLEKDSLLGTRMVFSL